MKDNNIKEASAIRSIMNCERTKIIFKRIKTALNKKPWTVYDFVNNTKRSKISKRNVGNVKRKREDPKEWDETYDNNTIDSMISEWCKLHVRRINEKYTG